VTTRVPDTADAVPLAGPAPVSARPRAVRWLAAVTRSLRPRQWPKNLLVFAAPVAGASLGRDDGALYALAAAAAFIAASSAVYLVNDAVDAERDRSHPVKRLRPIAAGELSRTAALVLAAFAVITSEVIGFAIAEPRLAAVTGLYIALSLAYTLALKHVPVVELLVVASGFLLRVIGGAIATRVPPSGWFLLVCSLGAFMVAVAKRYTELAALGPEAARHRPVMAAYRPLLLRISQRAIAAGMIAAYLLWAIGPHSAWMRAWHLASAVPLTAALLRFDRLTARATSTAVEDLIMRDPGMISCEFAWLALFAIGL
jgi:decaprenyl-phosphate phosphoribosyltransferase